MNNNCTPIDVTIDFLADTPQGKDPDKVNATLRKYHKLLWSKPLPSGAMFDLVDTKAGAYLYHHSQLGEFWLTSDCVAPSFRNNSRLSQLLEQIPEARDSFVSISYTIGGMMVFPGKKVGGKMTINGERGFKSQIKDRFDLTVECIRRHYLNEESPLSDVLGRYADFFRLFGDFRGYVEFFLLQDLVTDDFSAVKFFSPFDNFQSSPVPNSMDAYLDYRSRAISFIESRNNRIARIGILSGSFSPSRRG